MSSYIKYPLMLNKVLNYNNKVAMLKVLARAKETFERPKMMHFIFSFDLQDFETDGLCQRFKECFSSEIRALNKGRKKTNASLRLENKLEMEHCRITGDEFKRKGLLKIRGIPNVEIIYSVEAKIPTTKRKFALTKNTKVEPVYYHVHFMLICDVKKANEYSHTEIKICTNNALTRIKGVQDLNDVNDRYGFLKLRDKRSTIKVGGEFKSLYWHDLHSEYEDAIIRASYLTKVEQKELLPEKFFNNSFGHTRAPRSKK